MTVYRYHAEDWKCQVPPEVSGNACASSYTSRPSQALQVRCHLGSLSLALLIEREAVGDLSSTSNSILVELSSARRTELGGA